MVYIYTEHANLVLLKETISFYNEDLPEGGRGFPDELLLWKARWGRTEKEHLPSTALSSLSSCDEKWFPNIRALLEVFFAMHLLDMLHILEKLQLNVFHIF